MRDEKLHILQHSLGLDDYGQGREYRNHYCAGPGHDSWNLLRELVAEGLMVDRGSRGELTGGDNLFMVTEAGRSHVRDHSPAPPKLTRSQQRYRRFLDADCGLTFREWLREVAS